MRTGCVAAATTVAGLASLATAGITYTSQAREVHVVAGWPPITSPSLAARDFGPFNAETYFTAPNPDGWPDSWGRGSQSSTLSESGVRFTGFCEGVDAYGVSGTGVGAGVSTLDVAFTVTGSAGWTWLLGGEVDAAGREPTGGLLVEFTRVSPGPELLFRFRAYDDPIFFTSGSLPDGEYRLRCEMSGGWSGPGSGGASVRYDIALDIVPGPGPLAMAATLPLLAARRRRAS